MPLPQNSVNMNYHVSSQVPALPRILGLKCMQVTGCLLTMWNIAEIPEIVELNIGHFLMGVAIFTGLDEAIISMRSLMEKARKS